MMLSNAKGRAFQPRDDLTLVRVHCLAGAAPGARESEDHNTATVLAEVEVASIDVPALNFRGDPSEAQPPQFVKCGSRSVGERPGIGLAVLVRPVDRARVGSRASSAQSTT